MTVFLLDIRAVMRLIDREQNCLKFEIVEPHDTHNF